MPRRDDHVRLTVRQICTGIARERVRRWHRHLPTPPPQGLFSQGVFVGDSPELVGVAIVGRPTARAYQYRVDGGAWHTVEITRVATAGTPNACSCLYAACVREAARRGSHRIITYTLPEESGASLRGAGFRFDGMTRGGEWDRPARERGVVTRPEPKRRWVLDLKPCRRREAPDGDEQLALWGAA